METAKLLEFINNNWAYIAQTWTNNDETLCYYLRSEDINDQVPDAAFWSCVFSAQFIRELYGISQESTLKQQNITKKNLKVFYYKIFKPGHIYNFDIINHEFVIIYENNNNIYHVDYFMETGRGCRQIDEPVPKAFRVLKLTKYQVFKYLQSYIYGDIEYFTEFNQGDEIFYDDYLTNYQKAVNVGPIIINYTKHRIFKYPNTQDVIKTVVNSVKKHGIYCEYSEDYDNVIKVYFHNLSALIESSTTFV